MMMIVGKIRVVQVEILVRNGDRLIVHLDDGHFFVTMGLGTRIEAGGTGPELGR